MLLIGVIMDNETQNEELLEKINQNLIKINHNMIKVFWIVAIFAFLYFGLMLYLLIK